MLETFWDLPSTRMYGLGDHNLNEHIENQFYGGSVLDFVRDDENLVEKANPLLQKIEDYDKARIIGFYEFNNILVNQTGFYDIYMDIKILAIYDPRSKISREDTTANLDHFENVNLAGEKLKFENVQNYLNGFARIFNSWSYGKNADGKYDPKIAKMNKLYTVSEGEIQNGQLNGYNRLINPTADWVSVGYFKNNVPNGKLIKYVNFQKFQEGIFQTK